MMTSTFLSTLVVAIVLISSQGSPTSSSHECAPGCIVNYLEDSVCEPQCITAACGFDATDCTQCLSGGCLASQLGDGRCDLKCNKPTCGFDAGDCDRRLAAQTDTPYKEHNYGLVAGVGLGTFLIIFFGAVGLVFCVCSFATAYKELCIIIGLAIPLIVCCIIIFSPTEREDRQKTDTRVDKYEIARILFLVMLIPITLIAAFVCIWSLAWIELKTSRVDSRAVGEARAERLDLEEGSAIQPPEQAVDANQALLGNPPAAQLPNP